MDDTDRKLIFLLEEDPRMPLREISRRLGISRQSAHRRLQIVSRKGWFKMMRAAVHFEYFGAYAVAIWGRSDSASVDSVLEKLGGRKSTYQVEVLGGNTLFVIAGLDRISDLDSYVQFVKIAAEMSQPTVGIMCTHDGVNPDWVDGVNLKQEYEELSPLDLKIITSLRDEVRRPVSEIAAEIGASAKTVRRHLDKMVADGSIYYDQPWDKTSGEDMLTLLFVKLRTDADKVKAARRLLSIDPTHFWYMRAFSNIPGFLIGIINSDRMSEIRKILQKIAEDKNVLTATPNLIYDERMYYSKDLIPPGVMIRSSKKPRKNRARS